ncbi:MAG: cofactor-independent phosphoglycerate mutase [Dehalococcoidia bacterium]|nr:MAG: cofactor-independent phosphoglycerate mutase [Dehalococcoidia bacterium]
MKYCVLVIDGAAGWPLPEHGGKTCLELAHVPNLDRLAREGVLGLVRTVPQGMEPSSACACMSVLGYDPTVYYRGRSAIEAKSMGIHIDEGEVLFRCNLVAVEDGKMLSYCSGGVSSDEGRALIAAVEESLGSNTIRFYPGVGYRHICRITGREDTLLATCTPPHDIPDKPIAEFMPQGSGSDLLNDLMQRSKDVFWEHPVNIERKSRGNMPVTMIWLFWSSGQIPDLPLFRERYGLDAAMTSAIDLLRGLAKMAGIDTLDIPGVTDGPDNDYAAQGAGAIEALKNHDLVVIHVEPPDEAGHAGSIDDKIEAIQRVDREVVSRLLSWEGDVIRALIMPDHATPIAVRTHTPEPVPFLLWGPGFDANGAKRFTEAEAKKIGFFIEKGYTIMARLMGA